MKLLYLERLAKALAKLSMADEMLKKCLKKDRIEQFRKTAMAMNHELDDCMPEETRDERTQYKALRRAIGNMIKQIS